MKDEIPEQVVGWPPLHDGPNEPGPTDQAGEYRTTEQVSPPPARDVTGARVPGQIKPGEQPLDVASESTVMPETPEELSEAERTVGDPLHIARGKPATSSSEGSS